MGFLNTINQFLSRYDRDYRYNQLIEAALASAALLSLADGEISFSELMARDYITERLSELQSLEAGDAVEIFRTYAEKLETHPTQTKKQIFKLVQPLSDDRELGIFLIRMGIVLVKADQEISDSERKILDELGKILNISTAEIEELIEHPY
ncbi:MAG: tellurite resistance TerB family protein [Microcystaceae cyanobacterium]